ncbi:MAG: hypothetical protein ACFFAS_00005, partial [Promethearchaeota archaeon]
MGKLYFEAFSPDPVVPKAEILLVDIDNENDYPSYLQNLIAEIELGLTPFNTEYLNNFARVKLDVEIDPALFDEDGLVDISHLVLSVPNPAYELVVDEICLRRVRKSGSISQETIAQRVWQFTELESFEASEDPLKDAYRLEGTEFFGSADDWLEYLNAYDDVGNYYFVGTPGLDENDYQLLLQPNGSLTWNPFFNTYPEYFGSSFEFPAIIEPNGTLFVEYCTNDSWSTPIVLEDDNIDVESASVVYDYSEVLDPNFETWFGSVRYNGMYHYEISQYLQHVVAPHVVLEQGSQQLFSTTLDLGNFTLAQNFTNPSIYKITGSFANLTEITLAENNVPSAGYSFTIDYASNTINISSDGSIPEIVPLSEFDAITIVLRFDYGPRSTYTTLSLTEDFRLEYLKGREAESFESRLMVSYVRPDELGNAVFWETSDEITSDRTQFRAVPFSRAVSGCELADYDSLSYLNYEVFEDDSNVIYVADTNMDGYKDYKHEIDVDRDGRVDVTKYGVETEDGTVVWHAIVQDYQATETLKDYESSPELRTKWFDIEDRALGTFQLSAANLLAFVLCPFMGILYAGITAIMPDLDFWAQKLTKKETITTQVTSTRYYAVKRDLDRDGNADVEYAYERADVLARQEMCDRQTTIVAAKPQNVFTYIAQWLHKNWIALFGADEEDAYFNDELTKEKLDAKDLSDLGYNPTWEAAIQSTYRQFYMDTISVYESEQVVEKITVSEYSEGEIVEIREYEDKFSTGRVTPASKFLESITVDPDTGEDRTLYTSDIRSLTDPELLNKTEITRPQRDGVPEKFDSLTTISPNGRSESNIYEQT